MKKILLSVLALTLFSTTAFSQDRPDPKVPQGENLKVPEGWEFRLDKPDESVVVGSDDDADIFFVNMTPGWHLTTGPRGIFYHPANSSEGNYKVHTKMHYFNPNGRNREGYGLFFGGRDLEGDDIYYVYFLLRNTGEFLIKERMGAETKVVMNWTASNHIKIYDDPEVSSVENTLAVSVNGENTTFFINGEEVATINTSDISTDGVFGMRVNHAVNLHVEDLGVEEE